MPRDTNTHTHTQCSHHQHRQKLTRHCHTSQTHRPLPTHIHTQEIRPTHLRTHTEINTNQTSTDIHTPTQRKRTLLSPTLSPQDTCESGRHRHMSSDPDPSPHIPATTQGPNSRHPPALLPQPQNITNCPPRTHTHTHTQLSELIHTALAARTPKAPTENTGLT